LRSARGARGSLSSRHQDARPLPIEAVTGVARAASKRSERNSNARSGFSSASDTRRKPRARRQGPARWARAAQYGDAENLDQPAVGAGDAEAQSSKIHAAAQSLSRRGDLSGWPLAL